ncbi:hypothetical protein BDK51DRAFT_29493 [Blyttiomyces helicus]|uniref:Uncharacterized protein n=1 Tax=Blyttiomyces helicus TaxID=388810 RepID=A0A4V1ISP9_9FUNG|nr:hypothetical protein BDK51DRAFT_29493 [Blyttiomyces helicus]|eukprot:RKO94317.1 hypothetical protein BDK51DRAFT_29493 [Blyttiomyces helicus]
MFGRGEAAGDARQGAGGDGLRRGNGRGPWRGWGRGRRRADEQEGYSQGNRPWGWVGGEGGRPWGRRQRGRRDGNFGDQGGGGGGGARGCAAEGRQRSRKHLTLPTPHSPLRRFWREGGGSGGELSGVGLVNAPP